MDNGRGLTPFQRKMHTSAQQKGYSGEGFRLVAPSSKGACDDLIEMGITLGLICQRGGMVVARSSRSMQKGSLAGNQGCPPLKGCLICCHGLQHGQLSVEHGDGLGAEIHA